MNTPATRQSPDTVREALTGPQLASVIGAIHFVLADEYDPTAHPHSEQVMQRALEKLERLQGRTVSAAFDSRADNAGEVKRLLEALGQADAHESQAVMVKCTDLRAVLNAVPTEPPSRIEAIETAIRIGIFNTCMARGMSQDEAIAIVRGTMEQLCVASALAKGKDL